MEKAVCDVRVSTENKLETEYPWRPGKKDFQSTAE